MLYRQNLSSSENKEATPPLNILVVDDYQHSAESVAYFLGGHHFTVTVAHSGAEALQIFDEHRPGVAILDVVMRPLSGFEVARLIRSRPHGAKTLLIAITGWRREGLQQQCRDAGFDACFLKPLSADLKKLLTWWGSSLSRRYMQ